MLQETQGEPAHCQIVRERQAKHPLKNGALTSSLDLLFFVILTH